MDWTSVIENLYRNAFREYDRMLPELRNWRTAKQMAVIYAPMWHPEWPDIYAKWMVED